MIGVVPVRSPLRQPDLMPMTTHSLIIQLIIAYTLVGAVVFTVVITCLSLVGWIKFADQTQQNKLFLILIVELIGTSVAFFSGVLKYDPSSVERQISKVEQFRSLANGLNKFGFATEVLQEFLQNQLTTKTAMTSSVTEYNEAITALRENETTNLALLNIDPDKSKATDFQDTMQLVNRIDKSVHRLNDELEKVSILGTQTKINPDRAAATAAELKPLIADFKGKTTRLLNFSKAE